MEREARVPAGPSARAAPAARGRHPQRRGGGRLGSGRGPRTRVTSRNSVIGAGGGEYPRWGPCAGPRERRSWRGAPRVRIAARSGLRGQEAARVQAPMCEREVFQNGNPCLSQASRFRHPTTIISDRGSDAGGGSTGCSVSPPVGVDFFFFP